MIHNQFRMFLNPLLSVGTCASQKGSATVLTLFMSAIIITIGIGFNWIVKEHLRAAESFRIKSEGMLKAHAAFDTFLYITLSGTKTQKSYVVDAVNIVPNLNAIPLNGEPIDFGDNIRVSVKDANGMISLYPLNEDAFRRLIEHFSGADAPVIIASYHDWIDVDKLVRINGAEDDYYRTAGLPYKPRNYPLQYKEEIQFVRGMTPELWRNIEPHLTILPSVGFNPNTASDVVLKAYLGIDDTILAALKEIMALRSLTSDTELFSIAGRRITVGEGGGYYPSSFIEIRVSAGTPDPVYTIHAGLNMQNNMHFPYSVLFWSED